MAADPLSSILSALKREQIIPDVLPESTFTPSVLFSVVFPNGAEVNLGNYIDVNETQDEPEIRFAALNGPWDDAGEASYTLAMLDPDAPSRADPIYRTFRHWVVCIAPAPVDSPNHRFFLRDTDYWPEVARTHRQLSRSLERVEDTPVHNSLPPSRPEAELRLAQIQYATLELAHPLSRSRAVSLHSLPPIPGACLHRTIRRPSGRARIRRSS